jgi:type I thyroxine 5'-deiodinase
VSHLNIQLPALLDDLGNSAEAAYTGWPDRLYVIDSRGHIAYKSQAGPYGFKPQEMAAVLARIASHP